MPLCTFSDNYQLFDITPVENLFIQEFMLKAPGDFVKVYLYGLKQCYHPQGCENSIENFARALGLESKEVENAFRYWERQGILRIHKDEHQKITIEYFNIKDVLYNRDVNTEKILYKYREFNQNLQLIFDTRLLTPQEYLKIYDWIEILGLPEEVVLMMIRFYISKKGNRISINYLDKIAQQWAREGINTLNKAEEYIQKFESCYQDTLAVLKYLGIHRLPSKAELELYKKWRDLWGFSLNAILQACKETTKIQSPNMAYVDKILENFYKSGLKDPQDIQNHLIKRQSINSKIRDVLFHLGHKDTAPTPEHKAMYIKWTQDWNLSHEIILMACKECIRKKPASSFEELNKILEKWKKNNLCTPEKIEKYLNERRNFDSKIKVVLEKAGETRDVTDTERNIFKQWIEKFNLSWSLISLAAEYSAAAKDKLPYMNKILLDWHRRGITTVEEAQEDHERHIQASQNGEYNKKLNKQLDFNKFEQHTYTEEELEALFEDIENI